MAVLVDHRVGDAEAPSRRDDHHAAVSLAPGVAPGGAAPAALAELVPAHDADRHALDLVRMGRTAEQARVPREVDVRPDVEAHRAPLVVPQDDLARYGRACENGGGEDGEQRDDEPPCHAPTVRTGSCRRG
jgi:hypothetical protein